MERSAFERLPFEIAHKIISRLSLRTIGSLSETSKTCLRFCRDNSLWRTVCRRLVSNWVHSPFLKAPAPADWTLAFRWPRELESALRAHASVPAGDGDGNASDGLWFLLATQFLLPHLPNLGWHASNRASLGRVLLVTFDPDKCELVGEEIRPINLFDKSYYETYSSTPYQFVLPPARPAHPPIEYPLTQHMDAYRIPADAQSPYAGYEVGLFKPSYVPIPYFRVAPCEPSKRFAPRLQSRRSEFQLAESPRTFPSSETRKILREPHRSIDSLFDEPDNKSSSENSVTSIAWILAFLPPNLYIPPPNPPNIRHQTPLSHTSSNIVNPISNGRTIQFRSTPSTKHCPEEIFFPIQGPSSSSQTNLNSLWVGNYGHKHGPEFGHLVFLKDDDDENKKLLGFVKATGDSNVPNGIVSWKICLDDIIDHETLTIRGQGQIANTNYMQPGWMDIQVILVGWNGPQIHSQEEGSEEDWDELSGVNEITVIWPQLQSISTFFKAKIANNQF